MAGTILSLETSGKGYLRAMPSRRKKRNIYHINLLHKWHEEETVCVGLAEEEDEFEEEVTGWKMDSREGDCPKEGEQLSEG